MPQTDGKEWLRYQWLLRAGSCIRGLLLTLMLACGSPVFAQLEPNVLLDIAGDTWITQQDQDAPTLDVSAFVLLSSSANPPAEDGVLQQLSAILNKADDFFSQCGIAIRLERAQVLGVPTDFLSVEGNHRGESGGHPPDDVQDIDLFTYEENLRLSREVRTLGEYAKKITSPNGIPVFIVPQLEYYVGEERVGAAGLAYPPNAYHHEHDYPYRNLVLLKGWYESYERVPVFNEAPLWHELEHMLLNTGSHESEREARGDEDRDACARMRENLRRLFGAEPLPDPGPPGASAHRLFAPRA